METKNNTKIINKTSELNRYIDSLNYAVFAKDANAKLNEIGIGLQERKTGCELTIEEMMKINSETVKSMCKNFIKNEMKIQVVKTSIFKKASKVLYDLIRTYDLDAPKIESACKKIINSKKMPLYTILNGNTSYSVMAKNEQTIRDMINQYSLKNIEEQLILKFENENKTINEAILYKNSALRMFEYVNNGIRVTEYGSEFNSLDEEYQLLSAITLFSKIVEENITTWKHSKNTENNSKLFFRDIYYLTFFIFSRMNTNHSYKDILVGVDKFLNNQNVAEKTYKDNIGDSEIEFKQLNVYKNNLAYTKNNDLYVSVLSSFNKNSLLNINDFMEKLFNENGDFARIIEIDKTFDYIYKGFLKAKNCYMDKILLVLDEIIENSKIKIEARHFCKLLREPAINQYFMEYSLVAVKKLEKTTNEKRIEKIFKDMFSGIYKSIKLLKKEKKPENYNNKQSLKQLSKDKTEYYCNSLSKAEKRYFMKCLLNDKDNTVADFEYYNRLTLDKKKNSIKVGV